MANGLHNRSDFTNFGIFARLGYLKAGLFCFIIRCQEQVDSFNH